MQENAFLAMLAEGGYQVGALAKLRYPDGIEITDKTHAEAYAKTLEHLAKKTLCCLSLLFWWVIFLSVLIFWLKKLIGLN